MLDLANQKLKYGSKKKKKRVGRGISAGQGKTCGRGHKGQKSRSGGTKGPFFEGGQTPFYRRLPKSIGFTNIFRKEYKVANLDKLNDFEGEVKLTHFIEKGLLKEGELLKILGNGEISKALTVEAHSFSKSAKQKIEKAGGKAIEHH